MTTVILTDRSIKDLQEIERFSVKHWGKKTASKYLDDFDEALSRLEENPGLLREFPESEIPKLKSNLQFYRVQKHFILCDRIDDSIYVLAILHCSMDLSSRIADYEPSLIQEAKLLHRKLKNKTDNQK